MAAPDPLVYGPWSYLAWGYGLPCVVVGCETRDRRPGSLKVIECCHVHTKGMGGKVRTPIWKRNTFFACWRHHDEQHKCGIFTFAERYELHVSGVLVPSLSAAAAETYHQYRNWEGALSA